VRNPRAWRDSASLSQTRGLLLVHGWPQTWYAWRLVMPTLARDFVVIAPDQRGTALSGKPADGYDSGTLAADLAGKLPACDLTSPRWRPSSV